MSVSPLAARALLETVTKTGGVFFVLGRTDVGKSTLVQNLVRLVTARRESVAVLDVDLGQSTYGLPTTLTLARFTPGQEPPAPELIARVFIGATSPVGHLLQTVVGCRRLLDRAASLGARSILIDSTGLVEGPLAVEFKLQKIEALRPTHVVALARGKELEPILHACRRRADMTVRLLPVASAARDRSAEERRENRRAKYREYFSGAALRRFALQRVAVWGRMPQPPATELSGLLVGLNDAEGFCLGVGVLQKLTSSVVDVITPMDASDAVRLLRFGSVALDQAYNETLLPPRAW
jgi:polynucleotide 5'-hydroxyl-kinase GRC3/NOL9